MKSVSWLEAGSRFENGEEDPEVCHEESKFSNFTDQEVSVELN